MINISTFGDWSVMKALLPENDDFLNCTFLGSQLDNGLLDRILIFRDSGTAQFNTLT